MMPAQQLELVIRDPFEPRVMPQFPAAFFTINRVVALDAGGTRLRQSAHPLRLLAELLPACAGQADVYMSQAVFETPRRRVVNVKAITHAAVDLDCYHDPAIALLSTLAVVSTLLDHCARNGIPPPSIIISSGRGYYAKWFWSTPIPRAAAGRATALNRRLVKALASFHADPACVDMARVLRICGTVNGKSGRPVEIVHLSGTQDDPLTYEFDAFADGLLPSEVDAQTVAATHRDMEAVPRGRFTRENWHWTVLEDILKLAKLHFPNGMVTEGYRTTYAHLVACQLARVVPAPGLMREIVAFCSKILPADFIATELRRTSATLLVRAAGAKVVAFNGRNQTPIYGYSKSRLMDMLDVSPDNERLMGALISPGEKARRHEIRRKARRRAAGAIERGVYEAQAACLRGRVQAQRARGLTWRAIAAESGISERHAQRLGGMQEAEL